MIHIEPTHPLHWVKKIVLAALLISVFLPSDAQGQQTFIDSRLQPIILKSVNLLTDAAYDEALAEIEGIEELATRTGEQLFPTVSGLTTGRATLRAAGCFRFSHTLPGASFN